MPPPCAPCFAGSACRGPTPSQVRPARLLRQSDERSEAWLKRYLAFREDYKTLVSRKCQPMAPMTRWPTGRPFPSIRSVRCLEAVDRPEQAAWPCAVTRSPRCSSATATVGRLVGLPRWSLADADDYLTGAMRARGRLTRETSILSALGKLARLDSRLGVLERRAPPPARFSATATTRRTGRSSSPA